MTDKQKEIMRAMAGERSAKLEGATLVVSPGGTVKNVHETDIGTLADQQMVTAVGADAWALTDKGERYAALLG